MTRVIDLTGHRFGKLTVIKRTENSSDGKARWECLCDCGSVSIHVGKSLRKGEVKSCGCIVTKHGMASTPEYATWRGIKKRCSLKKQAGYKNYGGRGIKVCDRWLESFENFYEDMGARPEGMSIDRIDPDGDYTPENCRWTDIKTQNRNRGEYNHLISYRGITKTITEWSEELGIKLTTLTRRLSVQGLSVEEAFTRPLRRRLQTPGS